MRPAMRFLPVAAAIAVLIAPIDARPEAAQRAGVRPAAEDSFAARIAALSEPDGYFDTDNLISNERSYLHVVPALAAAGVRGGVYLGVGPDQNFSYIAHVRPAMAILIDIRRDNLLLHLLFKSLFELARTRVEYLALLTGRGPPEPIGTWPSKPVDAIVRYVEEAPVLRGPALDALRARIVRTLQTYGVPLSAADLQTIARFHSRFIEDGASLQFNTTGRAPQIGYPTYRDLLLEVDTTGAQRGFLVSEESFQFIKTLQARHLVVPIVGDLGGPSALAAVARLLQARGERVSAFYTSNVEFYLFRQGSFDRFIGNLARLPRAANAVIIRSVFGGGLTPALPGYNSVSLTQPIQVLLDGYARGQFRQYRDLTR